MGVWIAPVKSIRDTMPDAKPGPAEELASSERVQVVREAIAALPEDLRTALILSEYEQLSNANAADVLHCSLKAFESRLYRAKLRLRELLADKVETV
jgi:RNA polymerase sigma factor (sigma-70 family)